MEKKLAQLSCSQFVNDTASKAPIPGGGGVSALIGALGLALGDMVGELTVGKKKYAENEPELKRAMEESRELINKLMECIEKDAEAFGPLSEVYAMPKDTPGYEELKEKCLRQAAEAPMEILELSCRALELIDIFSLKGSRIAVSDAATGAAACRAAIYGAAANVRANTSLMKDRDHAEEMEKHAVELMDRYGRLADGIFDRYFRGA